MKNLLITGGAGFIGSNFVKFILKNNSYNIINLDALTYAGNLSNLDDVINDDRHKFVKGDICNRKLLNEIFEKNQIDCVINFAAESHVDRSILEPEIFLKTNVIGTQALLDVAMKFWKVNPNNKHCREFGSHNKFIQISTDEVYGTLGDFGLFTEKTHLAPNSPYSASKASADLIVRAYHETYGLPINITRCSNNYGPYQFPEKLIPLMINNAVKDKQLPVYGDGMQIRDWLHVEDHCSAIAKVLDEGVNGEIYNIGGNNEKANIDIVRFILSYIGKPDNLIMYVADRLGHDRRYAIDNSKIKSQLNWEPNYSFEVGLSETIEWYLSNATWLQSITNGVYRQYYDNI